MTKTQYIEENADYINESSLAAIEGLNEAEFLALIETGSAGYGEDPGIDNEIAKTAETLADFDNSRAISWHEKGKRTECVFNGFAAIEYEDIQVAKGQQRRSIVVIDFGNIRSVVTI